MTESFKMEIGRDQMVVQGIKMITHEKRLGKMMPMCAH